MELFLKSKWDKKKEAACTSAKCNNKHAMGAPLDKVQAPTGGTGEANKFTFDPLCTQATADCTIAG